jgi:GDP-mannose transporter
MVSATTYTLVGVVNKFLTVLLNVFVWDKHSTPLGIFAVCICLASGTLYQQAPRRDECKTKASVGGSNGDNVTSDLETANLLQKNIKK